ncbi:hypothetical protein, partial [Actinomadura verrucosospora]|uniref:hypothetical protein n=1 Tax=Actinomadura verrucosospora TaxID=46165 RepID=UPI0031EE9E5B
GTTAAGAAAGTAVAGGAGTAGTVAAGAGNTAAGFLAKASVVKAALVVAGATAAGTVGVVTYETTRPEAAEAPAVTLAALNRTYADGVLEVKGGQYAQVKGMKNASVQTAANRALRVPLDQAVTFYKEWGRTAAARAACGGRPNLLSTTVVKGLTGPDLVSVRYVPKFQRRCGEGPGHFPGFVVTVDLRTGRALTADDVFKPASFGVAGMKRLWDGLPEGDDKLQLMRGNSGSGGFFNPFHRSSFFPSARQPESPPWAQPFFGKNRFDLIYAGLDDGPATSAFDLGRTSCYDFAIPYGKVKDLFKPEFAARLPVA